MRAQVSLDAALLAVALVAVGAFGVGIWFVRDILERLYRLQRQADRANSQAKLVLDERAYAEALQAHEDALADWRRATSRADRTPVRSTSSTINWKGPGQ